MKRTFRVLSPPQYQCPWRVSDRLAEAIRKVQAAIVEQKWIAEETKSLLSGVNHGIELEDSYLQTLRNELSTFGIETKKVDSAIASVRSHDDGVNRKRKVEYIWHEVDQSFASFQDFGGALRVNSVRTPFIY